MPRFAPMESLLRVGKAQSNHIVLWEEGISLQSRTGRSLDNLRLRAAADRWGLAREFRRCGVRVLAMPKPPYRLAVGRFYYAMYHAMRAVAFVAHKGDDNQEHKNLPGATPQDFPNHGVWQNNLKSAREYRNHADYDPYPKANDAWRKIASDLEAQARDLLKLSRDYLRTRGCEYL